MWYRHSRERSATVDTSGLFCLSVFNINSMDSQEFCVAGGYSFANFDKIDKAWTLANVLFSIWKFETISDHKNLVECLKAFILFLHQLATMKLVSICLIQFIPLILISQGLDLFASHPTWAKSAFRISKTFPSFLSRASSWSPRQNIYITKNYARCLKDEKEKLSRKQRDVGWRDEAGGLRAITRLFHAPSYLRKIKRNISRRIPRTRIYFLCAPR